MRAARVLTGFLVVVLLPVVPASAGDGWIRPVEGAVARDFAVGADPFAGGQHRGIDLAAPAGTPVRAPCPGVVAVAGTVGSSGRVVTLRCGPWRVSHLPLATLAVEPGAEVGRGDQLGSVAASPGHAGLHLGVRRDGTDHGYVDPRRFFGAAPPTPSPPVAGRRPPRIGPPPRPSPRPPRRAPLPRPVRRPGVHAPEPATAAPRPDASSRRGAAALPWPAWLGLAMALGALGAGIDLRRRRRGAPPSAPAVVAARD